MLKISFIILIALHALIHLMGWIKAFDLAEIPQLTQPISRPAGVIWLLTTLLFLAAGALLLLKHHTWWIWGVAAVVLSQILIIMQWHDAKFGTIANLVIAAGLLTGYGKWGFNHMVRAEVKALKAQSHAAPPTSKPYSARDLPPIVKKWMTRSGALQAKQPDYVFLNQSAQMRLKENKNWMPVKAAQWFTIEPPGFVWKARVGDGSFMQFMGRDKLLNGQGNMLIRLFSLFSVVNASGEQITRGTAIRYLAEMIWFPQAALQPAVAWVQTGPLQAKAELRMKEITVSGQFFFTKEGNPLRFEADRYHQESNSEKPWLVEIDPHSFITHQGITIPARASVSWLLENEKFTWFKVDIETIRYL